MAETPLEYGPEDLGDPAWTAARAKWGSRPLLRVIDPTKGTDEIVPLGALADFAELLLDGCCLVKPRPDKPAS